MSEGTTNPLGTLRGFGQHGTLAAELIERFIADLDKNGLHKIRAFSLGAVVKAGSDSTDFACVSYEGGSELLLKGLAAHRVEAQAVMAMKRSAHEDMEDLMGHLDLTALKVSLGPTEPPDSPGPEVPGTDYK